MKKFTASTSNDLFAVVQYVVEQLESKNLVLLTGGLGAGKTTLIKQICRELGVESSMASPSFGLINEYETNQGLIVHHLDLYRLNEVQEVLDIGLLEILDMERPCFIEWPEIASEILHDYEPLHVRIAMELDGRRTIFVE
jgi:tRNA threonylcarbamoyladenosine biosynthesis protein TsaE